MPRSAVMVAALLAALLGAGYAFPAQVEEEPPKLAGQDVPAPKRIKTVTPEYPAEARIQGKGGIVILELIIGTTGHVAKAEVTRSVPPFDEAALAAVRKWEYEVTRVGGKPVSVRLTVPITFSMRAPEVSRQEGIPELRQGAVPAYPAGVESRGPVTATAEVTLEQDGRIAEATALSGDLPWTEALLQALRTWRFAASDGNGVVSFRVRAEFVPPAKGSPAHVALRLEGLRRSESVAPPPTSLPPAPTPAAPEAPPPSESPPPKAPPAVEPEAPPVEPKAPPAVEPKAPPVDVVPAAIPIVSAAIPQAVPTPMPGVSSVREVMLSMGVPDLVKGRRPVLPPFARMAEASGTVEVRFALDAAGSPSVQSVNGPDLLKLSAEQTVTSWVFRRTSTERLYLVAEMTYRGNGATALVRLAE